MRGALGFEFDAQAEGDAVDEGVVGDDLADVENGALGKSVNAEVGDVRLGALLGIPGELGSVIDHGAVRVVEGRGSVIGGESGDQLVVVRQGE